MRRYFKWDKKYLYWGVTAFCVIACAILFYMALNYISLLGTAVKALVKILSPFIWGCAITYLLAPLMHTLEKRVFGPPCARLYRRSKKNDGSKLARGLSVLLSELVFLAVIAALVYLILPQLYTSLNTIVTNSGDYIDRATVWVESKLEDFPKIEQYAMNVIGGVNDSLIDWLRSKALPELGGVVTNVTAGVYHFLMGVYDLVIGIIVSVYILSSIERFGASAKRLLYSVFSIETAERIRDGLSFTDKTFIGFINGKLLDSAIIGLICYILCSILRMPYSLLVSVIVGVTNVIPFFGPIIGAVPSGLIILMVDPLKCLIFVVLIIVLQQVDGNIIGPKILGNTVGINGFWVMFSIILGAGLFGFWGMLLGVPVFVVIYTIVNGLIDKKLKQSDLPWETADYMDIERIDPVTRRVVRRSETEEDEKETAQE